MFGWLNRRRQNEQKKLFYQNFSAVDFYIEYAIGGKQPIGHYEEIKSELRQIRERCGGEGEFTSWQDTDRLLEINLYLRKIHDESVTGMIDPFDETFKPLLGWKEYFSRND